MNIQRYKWPVIVAASLHGALFFSTPDTSIGREKTTLTKGPDLPPIPTDPIIQIEPSKTDTGDTSPARGGPAVPELPDVPVVTLEKTTFTIPKVDRPPAENFTKTLPDNPRGPIGTEMGPVRITGGPIGSKFLDREPRATAQISPDYPATMRQQGIAGSVVVEFDVNTEGRVVRAEVVRYTRREFADPALRAVRNWHFEPGKRNGRTVSFRMTVPIEFGLGAD